MLSEEAEIVVIRENRRMATEAVLIQLAISGVLGKRGAVEFGKTIKKLQNG